MEAGFEALRRDTRVPDDVKISAMDAIDAVEEELKGDTSSSVAALSTPPNTSASSAPGSAAGSVAGAGGGGGGSGKSQVTRAEFTRAALRSAPNIRSERIDLALTEILLELDPTGTADEINKDAW